MQYHNTDDHTNNVREGMAFFYGNIPSLICSDDDSFYNFPNNISLNPVSTDKSVPSSHNDQLIIYGNSLILHGENALHIHPTDNQDHLYKQRATLNSSYSTPMIGYGNHQRRKSRRRLTSGETDILNKTFELYPHPPAHIREKLEKQLQMGKRAVQIWFQNKRAKLRRCKRDQSCGLVFSPLFQGF